MEALIRETRTRNWQRLWTKTDVWKRWHLTENNPSLLKFLHHLCPDEKDKSGIFFVPMCGKSLDLKFIYEAGFSVLGVEICEIVIQEFFNENGLKYEVHNHSDDFKIYGTPDGRLKVLCGDILSLKKDILGGEPVKYVWDRGAAGSIEKELKKKYVQVLQALFQDSPVKYLLMCYQYRDWYWSFPPHNCTLEIISDLYGENFEIKELERFEYELFTKIIQVPVQQVTYVMTSKCNPTRG